MKETVLITGCSTGIGRATARAFLDDGWRVYATARDPGDVTDLDAAGAATMALDVTSTADAERAVDRIVDERGRLDCLVNNAGFGAVGPVEDVPTEDVVAQYDVNVFGPHRLMRAALPHMRERGAGTIVNVTSVVDRFPFAGTGAYSGSKAALATVSQALRQEVGGRGVDVVLVEPGFVATAFFDRMLDDLDDIDHTAAYDDLYALLEGTRAVERGGPGVASTRRAAERILAAANSDDPSGRYEVGPLATAGALAAAVVPASWRPPLLRLSVEAATTAPALRLLRWWNDRRRRTGGAAGERSAGEPRRPTDE